MKSKHKPFLLLKNYPKIVNNVTRVLNSHYLQSIVGQTHAQYLLIYIIGLILVERRQTMNGMTERIKVCFHDSLYRMLSFMVFPSGVLFRLLIYYAELYKRCPGWIIIDDTSIAKKFSKCLGFCGFGWCSSLGRVANGVHFVTLFWTDGRYRIPIGFYLWRPKDKSRNYRTKIDLALKLILKNLEFCRKCQYLVFDSWYCSKRFLQAMKNLGIPVVSSLKKNRNIVFKKRKVKVSTLRVGSRNVAYLPGVGEVLVCCIKLGKRTHYLVSTDTNLSYRKVRKRYKRRWPVEEFFRSIKQNLGLERFQCRKDAALVNHVTAVFLAYVVLEFFAQGLEATHGEVKNMFVNMFYEKDKNCPSLKQRRAMFKHVL